VSTFKRGGIWWYKFVFGGQVIRQSSKSKSKKVCVRAERGRHDQLERGFNSLGKNDRPLLFSVAAETWLKCKTPDLSPRSVTIERTNLKHLIPAFGGLLLCDITPDNIGAYKTARLGEKAANKTINLELGTIRAILRKYRMWGNIQPDVKMLRTRDDAGKALSQEEETALLKECRASRSRSLFVAVLMAIDTCMRYSEVRLLQWSQLDFANRRLHVGKSKTEHGDNRVIPISQRLLVVLEFWAGVFPQRKPSHFVFPFEKCGGKGRDKIFGFKGGVPYATDPTKPTGDWKEAWEYAKRRAGAALNPEAKTPQPLICRFHDLRHTGCTRMLEKGVPFSVVAVIMGWSASTAVRMAKRYGHIGHAARVEAIDKLASATLFDSAGAREWEQSSRSEKVSEWAQKWAQSKEDGPREIQ